MVVYPLTAREADTIRWISLLAPFFAAVIILFLTTASLAG